jgi:predicted P-loop ATPase
MKISVFNGSVKKTSPDESLDIFDFLDRIKEGYYKLLVDKIRTSNEAKRKELKQKLLPSVTVSGTFKARKDADLIEYSGLIAIDIDHREHDLERVREALKKDPHIFALFVSVSGTGLCAIVPTTTHDKHQDHFRWCKEHFKNIEDIAIDTSCRNISRARFVSYDPDLYINQAAKTAGTIKQEKKAKPSTANLVPTTHAQIDRMVSDIVNNAINIADDYEAYISCAFSLYSELGEAGRPHFHAIAMQSSKYDQADADKRYNEAAKHGRGDVSISTFIYYAKAHGVEVFNQDEREAFQIAKAAKRNHTDVQAAVTTAAAAGVDENTAKQIATAVFENNEADSLTDQDNIIGEIATFIKINTDLKRNIISKALENEGEPIDDVFYNSIYIRAKATIGNKVTKTDINSIIESDIIPTYCPVKKWLDEHQHLPQQPEIIDDLLNTIPYEKPETRDFIRRWLLGIPSTYKGDIVRLVLVLCGVQQTGKTQFFRRLLPEGLRDYYSENNLLDDSETALVMGKSLINMDDEFGGKSRKDALKFKELTSKSTFDIRLKYGRTMTKIKRLSMLCGTSNDTEILNDETGNTRILPVEFNRPYDFKAYNAIDKDQLFVELFRAHERGESWELPPNTAALLQELNDVHKVADFEQELIDAFLEKSNFSFMSTTEIKILLERVSGQRTISIKKLGAALKRNFDQAVIRDGKKTKRGYRCVTLENTQTQQTSEDFDLF